MCDTRTKEKTNGTKLWRLLLDGGTQVLREYLDKKCPSWVLSSDLKRLIKSNKIFPDEKELLCPSDGSQPDSKKFDISLLSKLLKSSICGLSAPAKGWEHEPDDSDRSVEANIVRIRLFRNKIQHSPGSGIDDTSFEQLWSELSATLKDLGVQEEEINNLKTSPIENNSEIQERFQKLIDYDSGRIDKLEKEVKQLQDRTQHVQPTPKKKVKSCIPDKPLRFIGRVKELKKIIDAKTNKQKPFDFVLVYGIPGTGKSTLIKKASWDLDKDHEKTVYFIDLSRCEASEREISKTMNYIIYGGSNVENEPREALNNWARNLEGNVLLVFDNAEDVMSQPHPTGRYDTTGTCFEKILLEIRDFSNQKVNYLIASREIIELANLSQELIELRHFEENESLEVINDICKRDLNGVIDLTEQQQKTIAQLCFHIALSLSMVVPLLDNFKPEDLIEMLKSNSEKDQIQEIKHLENVVLLSFEKLDGKLREFLVQLTVFSAPFYIHSAIAVADKTKDVTNKNLNTLLKKSFLQKDKRKYNFHPFIHKFVVDYGKTHSINLLQESTVNFRNHFQKLLLQNTKLYWTKDSCKKALSNFFEDRVHFEKALEDLNLDETSGKATETTHEILKNLTGVVMYLESCISWDLLGRLLGIFINLARYYKLVSRELESVCWKGHIARRKGDDKEYEKLVEEADDIYKTHSPSQSTKHHTGKESNLMTELYCATKQQKGDTLVIKKTQNRQSNNFKKSLMIVKGRRLKTQA